MVTADPISLCFTTESHEPKLESYKKYAMHEVY